MFNHNDSTYWQVKEPISRRHYYCDESSVCDLVYCFIGSKSTTSLGAGTDPIDDTDGC